MLEFSINIIGQAKPNHNPIDLRTTSFSAPVLISYLSYSRVCSKRVGTNRTVGLLTGETDGLKCGSSVFKYYPSTAKDDGARFTGREIRGRCLHSELMASAVTYCCRLPRSGPSPYTHPRHPSTTIFPGATGSSKEYNILFSRRFSTG